MPEGAAAGLDPRKAERAPRGQAQGWGSREHHKLGALSHSASLGLSFSPHEMRELASKIPEGPLRVYVRETRDKGAVHQLSGTEEQHSPQDKVAPDTAQGPELSPHPAHPYAGLVAAELDSTPAKARPPSGGPLSHTGMMSSMSPRALTPTQM